MSDVALSLHSYASWPRSPLCSRSSLLHSIQHVILLSATPSPVLSLTLDRYTDQNNWIKTFFSKYGLVGTRFTNKQTYKAPDPVMPSAVTGTVEKWMYASIYSDPTCGVGSGTLYR